MTMQKIAGDNPQFERSFADLAYAHLKDKAPKLLDFMVGFQVLDKNDDETRAAGIFGFEVGKQWFYAPQFFMNGELKGTELLYIKEQDAFVPLQENWVNYLISRKPAVNGGGTPFNESELGVISPNFRVYARSPLRGWDKTAGYCGNSNSNIGPCTYDTKDGIKAAGYWYTGKLFDVLPALPCFTISPNHRVYKEAAARMDLMRVVPELGVKAAKWLIAQIKSEPKFASALGKFYNGRDILALVDKNHVEKAAGVTRVSDAELNKNGLDRSLFKYYAVKLAKHGAANASGTDKVVLRLLAAHGVKSAAQLKDVLDVVLDDKEVKAAAVKVADTKDKLKVITRKDGINAPGNLNDQEKEELIHDGVVVQDTREDNEKSKVYDVDMVEYLANPDESGLYEMIGKDGKMYKVLIVQGPKTIGSGVANAYLVARLDGKGWAYMPKRDIFVKKNLLGDWQSFYAKLPSVTDMKENKRYTIVGPAAEASLVFDVIEKDGNEYMVDAPYGCLHTSPCSKGPSEERYPRREQDFFSGARAKIDHDYPTVALKEEQVKEPKETDLKYKRYAVRPISVTEKTHYLKPIGDTLMAPSRYKIMELDVGSFELGFVPGSITDAENMLWKHASLRPIKLHSDGLGYHIETDAVSQRMDVDDVYKSLILSHGITKSAARMMVERADAKGQDAFLVKYAAVYRTAGGPLTPGPNAPPVSTLDNNFGYDPQMNATISMPQTTYDPVGMPLGAYEDYNPEVLDKQTTQSVMRSAQSGNKEVLDTAVLSGMLKTMDSDSMIDKYLSDLVTGVDRIGRMLFLFYWHNDKFVDRYGEDEMKELEDVLKNTFKGVGDLVLFLKKRSIEPDVANMGSSVDLAKLT